jgi:hypothetical protein
VSQPQDFIAWASDPARSPDQLFTVELLLERMRHRLDRPFRDRQETFDRRMEIMKARKSNPAYRPSLPLDEIEQLQKRAATVTHFGGFGGNTDRPLRDIQALRFFPQLQEVRLDSNDASDLSPLAPLQNIKQLWICEHGDVGGCQPVQLSDCGEKPQLHHLWLSLRHAWPDLRALANWPALRTLYFNGNVLARAEVPELPSVEFAQIHKWVCRETPLRDLQAFPAMPKVKQLSLQDTSSLAGIERYPTVLNLEIGGEFRDLSPLISLTNVTFLKLTGEYFTDLTPLTRI